MYLLGWIHYNQEENYYLHEIYNKYGHLVQLSTEKDSITEIISYYKIEYWRIFPRPQRAKW